MPWISAIAVVLSVALTQPATPSSEWSDDGSAEAALLQKRVEAHHHAKAEQELGQRGLKFIGDGGMPAPADPGVGPSPPDAPTPDDPGGRGVVIDDLTRHADIERVVRQGRRLFLPGIILATLGTLLAVPAAIVIVKHPNKVLGGFLGVSLAIAAVGWPMAIVGVHKRRHPEKYLRNVALSPTGFAVRF